MSAIVTIESKSKALVAVWRVAKGLVGSAVATIGAAWAAATGAEEELMPRSYNCTVGEKDAGLCGDCNGPALAMTRFNRSALWCF
mmetsp:Transcript_59410/g.154412  ORF Transcript_59410/g.154412 Transcript_59410/m.154412 type:complete len:85 (+) Transcript_59410:2-256(+)